MLRSSSSCDLVVARMLLVSSVVLCAVCNQDRHDVYACYSAHRFLLLAIAAAAGLLPAGEQAGWCTSGWCTYGSDDGSCTPACLLVMTCKKKAIKGLMLPSSASGSWVIICWSSATSVYNMQYIIICWMSDDGTHLQLLELQYPYYIYLWMLILGGMMYRVAAGLK